MEIDSGILRCSIINSVLFSGEKMTPTVLKTGKELLARRKVRRVLLLCGIVSSLLYFGADILAAMLYHGYSYTSQTISELSAIGAPTAPLLSVTGNVYLVLTVAFGLGVWISAGKKRALRITGILLIIYGLVGFAWPFAEMHQREVLAAGGGTMSDTMHLVLGAVDSLLFFLIIGFGNGASNKRFRLYSIATIIVMIVFGTLMSMDTPQVGVNGPTPWLGITERVTIFGAMLWILVLSVMLLRAEKEPRQVSRNSA